MVGDVQRVGIRQRECDEVRPELGVVAFQEPFGDGQLHLAIDD